MFQRRVWLNGLSFTVAMIALGIAIFVGAPLLLMTVLTALTVGTLVRTINAFLDAIDADRSGFWKKISDQSIRLRHQYSKSVHRSGVAKVYESRSLLPHDFWRSLLSYPNAKQIDIMGQSLTTLFEDEPSIRILKRQIEAGCEVRILVLSPDQTVAYQQLTEVDRGLEGDPLQDKIRRTKEAVKKLRNQLDGNAESLRIRVSPNIMYCSIVRIDDDMVVSNYTSDSEGNTSPTVKLIGRKRPLFSRYASEFETMFGSSIIPLELEHRDRIRLPYHWKRVQGIRQAQNGSVGVLPLPATAVIFPTYLCTYNCGYCMYKTTRFDDAHQNQHMRWPLLEKTVKELVAGGVNCVEFSGGGEPTDYEDFDRILDLADKYGLEVEFGLLTNGSGLTDERISRIVDSFSYCRLSYSEPVATNDKIRNTFNQKLHTLIHEKKQKQSRINLGLKFLLSDNDYESFGNIVIDYCKKFVDSLDHIKVKSVRNLTLAEDSILKAEERLYSYVADNSQGIGVKVQLDLRRTPFVDRPRFKCWLNPLIAVIDPRGNVYLCCNYVNDESSKTIGTLSENNDFSNIWGQANHLKLIQGLNIENCDRESYCNCRIFDYQEVAEELFVADRQMAPHIPRVTGHLRGL